MDGDQVQKRCLNGPVRNVARSNQCKLNFRSWPLGEYLGPESDADFDSAVGWIAEPIL